MSELIHQLSSFARGMWHFRWWGMAVAWMVAVAGSIGLFFVPDKFEAGARIYVDTQSILKPLMSGLAIQPNIEQQVGLLSRTLVSRPNIEKLIRMADLDLGSTSKDAQEALIERLSKTIEIKNVGRDNLYTLSYRDSNPDKAKRVIQSLVSIFVESSLTDTRKDSDTAKKFIDEQIKVYVAKLEEAENRLKEFRLRNLDMQSDDGKDMAARIGEVSNQLNQARLELREAENARESARQQLGAEKNPSGGSATSSILQESALTISTPELDSRIDAQKRNLDGLLQRFTDQHPDVISVRKLIKDLEEQKRKEVLELRKQAMANPVAVSGSSNLAVQELSRLLATSEVQVASLRARVAEYESRMVRARAQLKTAPQVESEFSQLNRDYAINKKNYEDLVARRESASLSGDLDSASGIADFRLIDPPRVSPQPVSPNRLLLLPAVLLLSLGVGAASTLGASQVRPVFHNAHSLRSVLGMPVLGIVSLVVNEAQRRSERKDLIRFVAAASALITLFAIGISMLYLFSTRAG